MCSNVHKQHMMSQKPLKLKDYLELDLSSESSGSGFLCAPRRPHASTQRRLLEADGLRQLGAGSGRKLVRAQSRSAFSRLSAMISAVRFLPFSSGKAGGAVGLSRSLSRRLKGALRKKCVPQAPEVENQLVWGRHIVERVSSLVESVESRRSFDFPSPVVSICSSWSETASSSSDFSPSSSGSDTLDEIPCVVVAGVDEVLANAGELPLKDMQKKEMEPLECHRQDDGKEQLSPVSVMDFPYEEDDYDEDANDSTFHQILTSINRAKRQPKANKIRRFDVDHADLAKRFEDLSVSAGGHVAASEMSVAVAEEPTVEMRARALLEEVKAASPRALLVGFEKLLVDFFVHGLRRIDRADRGRPFGRTAARAPRDGPDELLRAARDWIRGHAKGSDKEAAIRDMERGGRWRCVDAEEEVELGEDLEGSVLDALVEELVLDCLMSRRTTPPKEDNNLVV